MTEANREHTEHSTSMKHSAGEPPPPTQDQISFLSEKKKKEQSGMLAAKTLEKLPLDQNAWLSRGAELVFPCSSEGAQRAAMLGQGHPTPRKPMESEKCTKLIRFQ